MGKKLAIQGHLTRGKEVIELLEMMGGKNCYNLNGLFSEYAYYIIEGFGNEIRGGEYILGNEDMHLFTLEEFLEKYPYKVGDKVFLYDNITLGCVTGMKWDEETVKYCVYTSSECWCDVKDLLKWNTIDKEEEMKSKREYDELRMTLDDDDKLATEATIMGKRILPPDGYLVGKITQTDNGMLVEYVEKKPVYPKSYKECCDVLLIPPYYNLRYHTYEPNYDEYATSKTLLSLEDKLNTLGKLFICRNAYWKIAGEQMGLDEPWDSKRGEWGYWIEYDINENKIYCQDSRILFNRLLLFPTEEMRDAFYENFKDLIEQCKELL